MRIIHRTALVWLTVICLTAKTSFAATNLNVVSTADNTGTTLASLTLRGAIAIANALAAGSLPCTITVPPGTYNLSLGELALGPAVGAGPGNKVSIIGSGTAATTLVKQTDGHSRVFDLDPNSLGGCTFALANLTIQGGHDGVDGSGGGGILAGNAGTGTADSLNLTNCVIMGNSTTGDGAGLGADGGSVMMVGCVFSQNVMTNGTTMAGAGCFFLPQNAGDALTAINCLFLQNSIKAVGASQETQGGGLALGNNGLTGSVAHLTNCVFGSNTVSSTSGPVNEDFGGGAIFVAAQSTVQIVGCTFTNNTASASVGGASGNGGNGGALLAQENQVSILLQYSRFIGNSSAANGGTAVWGYHNGSSHVTATDDWWGSQTGPALSVAANVSAANWLVLTNTAALPSVVDGGTDAITLSFLKDSAGNAISPANLMAFTNLPVVFGATDGTISGAVPTVQASGTATATFNATIPGIGGATATVDGVTVFAGISIYAVVTSIASSPATHAYKAGQVVPITLTFNAPATVTGTPKLSLNDGGTAVYSSGSGTSNLIFNYTVGFGENSSHLDLASTGALSLNGGTISSGGVADNPLLPVPGAAGSLGANSTILIDTLVPAIAISASSVSATNSGSVSYNVSFSDANLAAVNLSPATVVLNATGTASAGSVLVTPGTGSLTTTNYLVTLSGVTGSGTLGFSTPIGAATDIAGNVSALTTSSTFTVFRPTAPSLTNALILSNGSLQFQFTSSAGVTFTVLSSTNLSLPLSQWNVAGSVSSPTTQYQFTTPTLSGNAKVFYAVRAP